MFKNFNCDTTALSTSINGNKEKPNKFIEKQQTFHNPIMDYLVNGSATMQPAHPICRPAAAPKGQRLQGTNYGAVLLTPSHGCTVLMDLLTPGIQRGPRATGHLAGTPAAMLAVQENAA